MSSEWCFERHQSFICTCLSNSHMRCLFTPFNRDVILAREDHLIDLKFPFDGQKLATIGHPALVPDISGSVIETETLTLRSVFILILLS